MDMVCLIDFSGDVTVILIFSLYHIFDGISRYDTVNDSGKISSPPTPRADLNRVLPMESRRKQEGDLSVDEGKSILTAFLQKNTRFVYLTWYQFCVTIILSDNFSGVGNCSPFLALVI